MPDKDSAPPMRRTKLRIDAEVIDMCDRVRPSEPAPGISHLTRILDLGGRSEPHRQAPHPGDPGPDAA